MLVFWAKCWRCQPPNFPLGRLVKYQLARRAFPAMTGGCSLVMIKALDGRGLWGPAGSPEAPMLISAPSGGNILAKSATLAKKHQMVIEVTPQVLRYRQMPGPLTVRSCCGTPAAPTIKFRDGNSEFRHSREGGVAVSRRGATYQGRMLDHILLAKSGADGVRS